MYRANFFVIFISASSLQSAWATKELNLFIGKRLGGQNQVIIPILIDDAEIPPVLRDTRYVDLRDGNVKRAAQELIEAIHYHMAYNPSSKNLNRRLL